MIFNDAIIIRNASSRTDRHRLGGTVTVDGQPAERQIFLFRRTVFSLLAVTRSASETGDWMFAGLPEYPERDLIVITVDHTGNYNAEVADFVSQVQAD